MGIIVYSLLWVIFGFLVWHIGPSGASRVMGPGLSKYLRRLRPWVRRDVHTRRVRTAQSRHYT